MYYPQSQIIPNLFTNGGELQTKRQKQNYVGSYWKTADGKFFTGKTPQDINIQELILITQSSVETVSEQFEPQIQQVYLNPNDQISTEYTKLNNKLSTTTQLPNSFNPTPTQQDYNLGEFSRYFVKKSNELIYLEINKETYNKIQGKDSSYLWQLYFPFKYNWKLSGKKEEVYKINKNITEYFINKFKLVSLNKFLKEDYLKFYKL